MWRRILRLRRGPRDIGFSGIYTPGFDHRSVGRLFDHHDIHDDVHSDLHLVVDDLYYAIDAIDAGAAHDLTPREHSLLQSG